MTEPPSLLLEEDTSSEPQLLLEEDTSSEPQLLRSVPSSGSFTRQPVTPATPMTPRSPGSPSAFFYHTATANIVVLAPPSPSDSNVSCSGAASTGGCGACKTARRWLRKNVVQRVLSALVLVPLITIFLWLSPAFATATFCTFVTSICSFEYAWLQHRIYLRIMTKMNACEPHLMRRDANSAAHTQQNRDGDSSRVSDSYSRSTRSESGSDGERNIDSNVAYVNRGRTAGSTSGETVQSSPVSPPLPPRAAAVSPRLEDIPRQRRPSHNSNVGDDEDYLSHPSFSKCAVSNIADKYFKQNEWVAALVLSAFSTVVTTTAFLIYVNHIPELQEKQLFKLRWFYSVATDYVTALCAFFTPNWRYAFICIVEKAVFTLLTMHSTACPINRFRCGVSLEPAQVFLSGVVVIVFFRLQTRTSGPATFLHIALDMLGYLYIIGSLSVIVAFVDDERLESYRKLLIVLLYVVWASDTGAYLTGKILERCHYSHYNPLASHLSKNKDYEGTLGAVFFGVTAMFISSDLLNVPGSAIAQIGFTVLAVVVGRLGDLFESLLKRAAGVKDSGKLIPGHGGVLDRIDALMFASLVFARYYASIVM
ncbi:Phosphatidate cytidylyltransferase [Phytophthora cinnamomi]|uniref:Phosphatidate cytidylyltransferase n=1 Tax=Phytophthora cinnamomi TaxID=4785 RepID=UPI00355AC3DF|nr:Phosphatidate cytidylyltransferase [Phytophthora cinnamomi]